MLEFAEDIAIDIPMIWDYLGELLSPIVAHSTLSLSLLSSVVPSLVSEQRHGEYNVTSQHYLLSLVRHLGDSAYGNLYRLAGCIG